MTPETHASDASPPALRSLDAYCLACGYNLRGLAGDPIRCPECFHQNPRHLVEENAQRARVRLDDLLRTLDVCLLTVIVTLACVALWVTSVNRSPTMAVMVIAIPGIVGTYATLRTRRVFARATGYVVPLVRYAAYSIGVMAVVPLLLLATWLLSWLVAALTAPDVSPRAAWLHIPAAVVFTLVIVVLVHPVMRFRARQLREFDTLIELAGARSALSRPTGLQDVLAEGSLPGVMNANTLHETLTERFAAAIEQVAGAPRDPLVRPAQDPHFGDYQCNAAMSLAKPLRAKPREIAERIVAATHIDDIAEPLEVAGPGFINIRLRSRYLADSLGAIPAPPGEGVASLEDRLGIPAHPSPSRVVIDYSSPNIAKQMHVGHLRSTIIGDVFARVLGFVGHGVIRQNHVGDWGTQFGILIEHYQSHPIPTPETHADVLEAIEDDYRSAQERFKADPDFAAAARAAVGRLQSGDPEARKVWEQICGASRRAFTEIYRRLHVLLSDEDVCGESFYNDRLAEVVSELGETFSGHPEQPVEGRGHAEFRTDQGAKCLYLYGADGEPMFKNPEGEALPMIVQKSDGAYNYDTTDLAAIRYRISERGASRLIYVTDARQIQHFEMLFAAARLVGWAPEDVVLEHVWFGSVLGEDGKPLKTREGKNVRLRELLDEAESRALRLLEEREAAAEPSEDERHTLSEDDKRQVARRIGIGAVKYADLSRERKGNYVFSWDNMLAFQGNTAPYMMYAYARIRSIYRKSAERFGSPDVYAGEVGLTLPAAEERALALRLLRFREILTGLAADLKPHTLCNYLYELAADFMRFYESCPVIAAPDDPTRLSRMRLCDLTARTLKVGLALLGIEVVERM